MKYLFTFLFAFLSFSGFGNSISLIGTADKESILKFELSDYSIQKVQTSLGELDKIVAAGSVPNLKKGAPELPQFVRSLIVDENYEMDLAITDVRFTEYSGILIQPSKGNFYRNVLPENVPLEFGSEYSSDSYYPSAAADLREAYILRDFRGQTVMFRPFQYNPVTKTLRVYTSITVKVTPSTRPAVNPLVHNNFSGQIDPEFFAIYKRQFANFESVSRSYSPLSEQGKLLILCDPAFIPAMQPYISWKKRCGIPTELVDITNVGATESDIMSYVHNYFNSNGLTYLLLVGDHGQIPSVNYVSGYSDNAYGYVNGGDSYPEFFVGRFSAETPAHVSTHVTKVLNYEKLVTGSEAYFKTSIGIGSDQGPGDDNEMDFEHIRGLQSQHAAFTYNSFRELFDGSQGSLDASGNPTAAMLGAFINQGAGLINYTGHGADYCSVTTGFSNTDIDNLTNYNKLPFFWSVACVNGDFITGTCYAEKWLRAMKNNQPTGAVATMMATINQSWNPPMEGQDEMNAILVESYSSNIKRTFAGISMNGCMQMNDAYGAAGDEMTDTWTCFGDPTLTIRTDIPAPMTATHITSSPAGISSAVITSNTNGAVVSLTVNGEIIGSGVIQNGSATIGFAPINDPTIIDVTVTAFNKIPYMGEINVNNAVSVKEVKLSLAGLYPNPAGDVVNLVVESSDLADAQLRIISAEGKVIEAASQPCKMIAGANSLRLDLSLLPAGMYFLELNADGNTIRHRFAVAH